MYIFITSFLRIICFLYIFRTIVKNISPRKYSIYAKYPLTLILLILSIFFQHTLPAFNTIINTLFYFIYILILFNIKYDLALVCTAIAYSIYYGAFCICSLITTILIFPTYSKEFSMSLKLPIIITSIITLGMLHLLLKIKRFKSGLSFLTNQRVIYSGLAICSFLIITKTIDTILSHSEDYLSALPVRLLTFLLAILLVVWWRRQITKSYIEKLHKLELQSLYEEIEAAKQKIEKLTEDNDALARIIHKDNKRIPAMQNAVTDYLQNAPSMDEKQAILYGEQLSDKLRLMTNERKGNLDAYRRKHSQIIQTGYVAIDSMLAYMQKRALENNIKFECKYTKEILAETLTQMTEDDLSHLLSDLLENALISIKGQATGKVQVTFGKLKKECYLSVADTGIPFDIKTLHCFGLSQHTSHKDEGGSGIGLMDIWKLKRKYRASIQIQEYRLHRNNFTKKITLSLNRKNHYVIQSYRYIEIINTQTRGDLYVIPAETEHQNGGITA